MAPPQTLNRIHLLDVLRGVAIVGTLGTNIWLFASTQDALELMFAPREWWASAEDLLVSATLFLTNGKFLSLLAILFGVGIEIQYRAARRRGRPWLRPYGWRTSSGDRWKACGAIFQTYPSSVTWTQASDNDRALQRSARIAHETPEPAPRVPR